MWVTTQRIIDAGLWVWQLFPADTFNAAFEACQQFDVTMLEATVSNFGPSISPGT